MTVLNAAYKTHSGTASMDKKRLEYYKKKLQSKREELLRSIARTEEEGRSADDDPTVDLADKAANSYTKEFLFGQNNTDRTTLQQIDEALNRIRNNSFPGRPYNGWPREPLRDRAAAEAPRSGSLGQPLYGLPGKARARTPLTISNKTRAVAPGRFARPLASGLS